MLYILLHHFGATIICLHLKKLRKNCPGGKRDTTKRVHKLSLENVLSPPKQQFRKHFELMSIWIVWFSINYRLHCSTYQEFFQSITIVTLCFQQPQNVHVPWTDKTIHKIRHKLGKIDPTYLSSEFGNLLFYSTLPNSIW